LERARAVLADAREQMPGLLRAADSADGSAISLVDAVALPAAAPAPAMESQAASGSDHLGRLEEMLVRLEEERRQLGAEVAALRLIVEELREALVRVDERTTLGGPAFPALPPAAPAALEAPHEAITKAVESPIALPSPADGETNDPRRGTCVEVRLLSAEEGGATERLRQALEAEPDVERVGLTPLPEGEAILQLELRSPQTDRQLASLLERAAPAAKPLAAAVPGTFLLRLRPS
jgi:hypothetical protein